jgi:Tfp pilus assembly protein PilN
MAQQINLCAPILLTQKKYFSAHTMAASLGVFVVLGGLLLAVWTWNLQAAAAQYQSTMEAQTRDVANLQAALARNKAAAQPVDAALSQQLEARKLQLVQRQALLAALQEGGQVPGNAHSDRLRFLASTVPSPVWITGVSLATGKFQVAGYTLEPAALNDWVARMATHPLLQGLQLSDVQVKSVTAAKPVGAPPAGSGTASTPVNTQGRPLWSFELVNTRPVGVVDKASAVERKP